jgi:predicted MFS family arabinose efflux permease
MTPSSQPRTLQSKPSLSWLWLALALSLGAAVSLGITRFAYGLLLPPMRIDLGWSYTLAGAMNTANALGYLLGALTAPHLLRQWGPGPLLVRGACLAAVFMAGSGFFTDATPLLFQRLLAGLASAWVFVAGGLLAARLGTRWPQQAGLLLGLYYGGTGWGIMLSAFSVPVLLVLAEQQAHAWAWAWWGLALLCLLAWGVLHRLRRHLHHHGIETGPAVTLPSPAGTIHNPGPALVRLAPAMLAYSLFGVGYIGYMTFVIALLREQGASGVEITVFYAFLGAAVVASSRIWSGLLDRHRGGGAIAQLNAWLGLATLLPAVSTAWPVVLLSGLLFGGVFLSVVASTTALVRHNLPSERWASGISAFTIVFACGQMVGPSVVGWIADSAGGLGRGLWFSAIALFLGACVAVWQRPLD